MENINALFVGINWNLFLESETMLKKEASKLLNVNEVYSEGSWKSYSKHINNEINMVKPTKIIRSLGFFSRVKPLLTKLPSLMR